MLPVPLLEQLIEAARAEHVGIKHQHQRSVESVREALQSGSRNTELLE